MNYYIHKPNGILKDYIKFIWSMNFDDQQEGCNYEKLMPSGCVEIIFNLGKKLSIKGKNNNDSVTSNGLIGGQKTTYSQYIPGSKGIISVVLFPNSAFPVIGLPLNELNDCYIEPEQIWGEDGKDIVDKIIEADNNLNRIKLLESFILNKIIKNQKSVEKRLTTGINLINISGGQGKIGKIAEKVCLSKRQMERLFKSHIGLSPKEFSKIVRFQNSLFIKQNNLSISLTELSIKSGYYDQAHFINDFKSITGYNPKEYFNLGEIFSDYFSY